MNALPYSKEMDISVNVADKTPARLPAELVESNLFLLKRLGFAAKQRSIDEYERIGLNPYHYAILALLDVGAPETQAAIADALGYDRGTLVGLLDELEEQALVERKRSPDDRRRHLVRLTADGKKMLGKLRALSRAVGGRVPRTARHAGAGAAPRASPGARGAARAALCPSDRHRLAQRADPGAGGRFEARQRLADRAVVHAGGAVLAAGEDPVAGSG